ncbi:MAG: single-stranded DNA-binding protein [Microcystaceae cyanobacterium]
MDLNVITLVGRAGRDPEVKYFESGKVVCNFTLAVDDPIRKASHKKNNTLDSYMPDWFDLEIWGKTAEIAASYVKKGSLIGVQGLLKFDAWSDRATGASRSKPVIRVDRLDLLGSKRDNEASMGYSGSEF